MALPLQGFSGNILDVDSKRALLSTARPVDYTTLGIYSIGAVTGILPAALAANSEIFQWRWADATRLCLILEVIYSSSVSTTMFAAGVPCQTDLVKSTAWTVQGTGGTPLNPAAMLKTRSSMGSSLLGSGDVRIATTAALGAGTKTLETLSLGHLLAGGPITNSLNGTIVSPGTSLWLPWVSNGMHPGLLAQNEGFSVRSVAVPGTGTWTASINVRWAELAAY